MTRETKHLIPTLRYRDAHAAIAWLGEAFGFVPKMVIDDGDGGVRHSQLVSDHGMIMVGTYRDDPFGAFVKTPEHVDGVNTQSVYIVVSDADAHHTRAVAAGAKIVRELCDEAHGGRAYACVDPGGHLWSVGSYDPWVD